MSREERRVLGVGQLITGLQGLLEQRVGRIWVGGEISNLHQASSGHSYFTLKDEAGQIRAALFRGNASRLRFDLEEGLEVVVEAEVSIYAARGDLQLIVRSVEPRGVGALQLAFEQLRKRLKAAGLFEPARKQPLPAFPRRVGVVTSPTSAALRDVLKVASRRFPATPLLISPTLVQGEEAPAQVARAIARVAEVPEIDLILVVRGGGSLEDLWAFNTEVVAKAIAACPVPIMTGVGHETDVTIADEVADARAPTPSAAVIQGLPDRAALAEQLRRDRRRMVTAIEGEVDSARARVASLEGLLEAHSPQGQVALGRARQARARAAAEAAMRDLLQRRQRRFATLAARLDALSPLAVLGRGYAIVHRAEDGSIVRRAADVSEGDALDLRLAEGIVRARVTGSR